MSHAMYRFLELTVGRYMTRRLETVRCATTLGELEVLFRRHDFNAFPVTAEGLMVGLVSKFDFLKAFAFTTAQLVPHYNELMRKTVQEVMTKQVVSVERNTPLTRVLHMMVELRSRSFPVVGPSAELVGMIAREDIMRALQDATKEPTSKSSA